tara:strand:+ start:138 stop:326 length:189 start_codon:yes stop_codon:yes gene_type:complete
MISNLNLGLKFIFKSSINPNKKNNVQKEIYSKKRMFCVKNKYEKTIISEEKIVIPPNLKVAF